jgi:large subunit ribosomal protein L22
MKAITRTIRITPKKLSILAQLVREKDANEAITMLGFAPKKAAKILQKTIISAVSNATNNYKQDAKDLYIKEILVTKATVMKRFRPASRGRSMPILKRNSHLTVTLGVKEGQNAAKEVKEDKPKKTVKTTTTKAKRTTKK